MASNDGLWVKRVKSGGVSEETGWDGMGWRTLGPNLTAAAHHSTLPVLVLVELYLIRLLTLSVERKVCKHPSS